MSEYTDSGILFQNKGKKELKHPDYKGDLTVRCEHCAHESKRELAAWIREGKAGKFLSLSFKPKSAPAQKVESAKAKADDSFDFLS